MSSRGEESEAECGNASLSAQEARVEQENVRNEVEVDPSSSRALKRLRVEVDQTFSRMQEVL